MRLIHGDCVAEMRRLVEQGVKAHSIVTDPPYGLTSVVKRFGKEDAAPAKSEGPTGVYARASAGFMGQKWDGTGIEYNVEMWRLCWQLLPPGGHLLAFGGTRTWHRIASAIEDAGFEIRDSLMWLYGTGFPKSHNQGGAWQGWGTALKPAWEPVIVARKPLAGTVAQNVLAHGTGALNIDGCRIAASDKTPAPVGQYGGSRVGPTGHSGVRDGSADNLGRWPANVVHDGSDEVEAAFAAFTEGGSPSRFFYCAKASRSDRNEGLEGMPRAMPSNAVDRASQRAGDEPSSGRGSRSQPRENTHPTVKPTELMRWLARMVTPPGGTVLDPFMGSGSTGKAAMLEGFDFIGIEQDADYIEIARRRITHVAPVVDLPTILATAAASRAALTEALRDAA